MTEQTRKVLHARLDHPIANATASTRPKKPPSPTAPCMASCYASKTGLGRKPHRLPRRPHRSPRHYYSLASDGAARTDVALTRAA